MSICIYCSKGNDEGYHCKSCGFSVCHNCIVKDGLCMCCAYYEGISERKPTKKEEIRHIVAASSTNNFNKCGFICEGVSAKDLNFIEEVKNVEDIV